METISLEKLIWEVHAKGARLSDGHDALVHCLAGIRKRHQQWNDYLHQYDVAIITAVNLSARIDENDACAS